jgi:uncharacterized protein YdeI (YjbR/CyaY-like superfamily)
MMARFFKIPAGFRQWLDVNHSSFAELWVGFYKKGSGKPSVTWPESADEALCFGWIDRIRKSLDDHSYAIRFTPRKPQSTWSAINIARAKELIEQGRMRPAGMAAFQARKENKSGIYSYEQRSVEMPEPYASQFQSNRKAWQYYQSQSQWYRKTVNWWVISAKREATRSKRLEKLIDYSEREQPVPDYARTRKTK